MSTLTRHEIAARLRELANYLRLSEKDTYRARAYDSGADAVDALADASFQALLATNQLTTVPGIGPSLSRTIAELAATGTTATLEKLRQTLPPALISLAGLPGLTPARLREAHDRLGVTTVAELHAALDSGRLRLLKGFGGKTEERLRAALARQESAVGRVRLEDAQHLGERLKASARAHGAERADVAGAVRRGDEIVGELVVVVATPDPATLLATADGWSDVAEVRPGTVATPVPYAAARRGQLANGLTFRVVAAPAAVFTQALFLETATLSHLEALAARSSADALANALRDAPDEADIYQRLGLAFIPPEQRTGDDELARAAQPDGFSDLITHADLRGAVHCHTTHSDGRNSVLEMARAAQQRGFAYITITDHSPTASYAGGVTTDRLRRQWDEIDEAQAQLGPSIRLLRGTESDILEDGALDYPDDVLERFDVVVASVHNRYHLGPDQMTQRLVRMMELPVFKIWGHPLGRLLLRRDPIDCNVEAVLDAAAASRACIEINGDPNRLDLPVEWLRQARARGLRFVVSADAHSVSDLEFLHNGITLARRGGVRRSEVLNTLPVDDFAAAVRPSA